MCGGYIKYIGPTFRTSLCPGPMGRGSLGGIPAHSFDNTARMHPLPRSDGPTRLGQSPNLVLQTVVQTTVCSGQTALSASAPYRTWG